MIEPIVEPLFEPESPVLAPRYAFNEAKHIHTLDLKPLIGTTTCISETLQKAGLTWWASGMACTTMGWLNSKKFSKEERIKSAQSALNILKHFDVEQYLYLLDEAYKSHNEIKKSRADEGTDLHALAEEWIKWRMQHSIGKGEFPDVKILPFTRWCDKNVKRFLFSEIHCYSERLWCGGKTDFGYIDMNDKWVLADIKSRDKAYFGDVVQSGFYDIQLSENGGFTADGRKIFDMEGKVFDAHAIFTLTDKFVEPVMSYGTIRNRNAAEACIALYKAKKSFEDVMEGK